MNAHLEGQWSQLGDLLDMVIKITSYFRKIQVVEIL